MAIASDTLIAAENGTRARITGTIWLFIALGLVPNILFILTFPSYLVSRLIGPLIFLIGGGVAYFLPRPAAYFIFVVVAALDLALAILVAFHLPFGVAIDSLRYMASIDVYASTLYILIGAATLAAALLTAFLFNRYRHTFAAATPTPVVLFALGLCVADYQINYSALKTNPPRFDSAAMQAGLTAATISKDGRNLLLVLVEGLGAFSGSADRRQLASVFEGVTASGRYTLLSGATDYSGSTTAAESRELCGRWGDHMDYLSVRSADCLPRQLANAGYETVAYHGFSSDMFARNLWYPVTGFGEMHFQEQIVRDHRGADLPLCGSVFEGLCDKEVAALVHQRLKANSGKPKFVYWLTLNTHIPYVAKRDGRLRCGTAEAAISNKTVCELTELWADVFEGVAAIASDPDMPPTDILIVGDHHTPLWERDAKNRFIAGKVDWFLLRHNALALAADARRTN